MAINFNELSTTAPVPTKDEVDNKIDKLSGTVPIGNLLKIADDGGVEDSGKSLDDISREIQDAIEYAVVVDDKLVPTEGPGTSKVDASGGNVVTYLAGHLPTWTCNGTFQSAVERNRGESESSYHYDPSLFPDRIVFWVEGKEGGQQGLFTRSIIFPKAGVYSLDIEYAAGYASYPNTMGQARFVVDAGNSGEQDVIGINDPSIVQHAHVQFEASNGAGSITIKGKTGLAGNACCVVIASVKVTLAKEIGIEIGDIVAPDIAAQTGQAADAKATATALAGKLDAQTACPEFRDDTSYAVGDVVLHSGKLYKCTANSNGAWDPTKWVQTTLVEVMSRTVNANVIDDQLEVVGLVESRRNGNDWDFANSWSTYVPLSGCYSYVLNQDQAAYGIRLNSWTTPGNTVNGVTLIAESSDGKPEYSAELVRIVYVPWDGNYSLDVTIRAPQNAINLPRYYDVLVDDGTLPILMYRPDSSLDADEERITSPGFLPLSKGEHRVRIRAKRHNNYNVNMAVTGMKIAFSQGQTNIIVANDRLGYSGPSRLNPSQQGFDTEWNTYVNPSWRYGYDDSDAQSAGTYGVQLIPNGDGDTNFPRGVCLYANANTIQTTGELVCHVRVPMTGRYQIEAELESSQNSDYAPQTFDILVDSSSSPDIRKVEGSELLAGIPTTVKFGNIYLSEGEHSIRLRGVVMQKSLLFSVRMFKIAMMGD